VTTLARQASYRWPVFLPDGRHFLCYVQDGSDTRGIWLGALDAKTPTRLTVADTSGTYLPGGSGRADAERDDGSRNAEASREGGWLLWVRGGTLVAQRLDLARAALTGDPVLLADGVAVDGVALRSAVSVSATGLVAYRSGGNGRRQLTWRDRTGKVLGTLGAPDESGLSKPSVALDGRRVAVARTVQGNTDLWLLDGARTSRFTFDPAGQDRFPIWSPDGGRIVFESDRTGPRNLYVRDASGAGAEALLVDSAQAKLAFDWSADGRFLLYYGIDPHTRRDLWVRPMAGDQTSWVFLKTPFEELGGRFSPDGRWVAYMSNESGRLEIYVRPSTGGVMRRGWNCRPREWAVTGLDGRWDLSELAGGWPRVVLPRARRYDDGSADRGAGGRGGAGHAGGAVSDTDLRQRRGHSAGPAIRRDPRRPLPDQHRAGRRDDHADHAHPALATRREAVTPRDLNVLRFVASAMVRQSGAESNRGRSSATNSGTLFFATSHSSSASMTQ